ARGSKPEKCDGSLEHVRAGAGKQGSRCPLAVREVAGGGCQRSPDDGQRVCGLRNLGNWGPGNGGRTALRGERAALRGPFRPGGFATHIAAVACVEAWMHAAQDVACLPCPEG